MPGFSDYNAENALNATIGVKPFVTPAAVYAALFTAAPTSDAGSGGTEVSGNGYARVQVAGAVTAAGAISTASATITMPNVSGSPWVVAGMNVYDITAAKQIGTVLSWVGTTLTLTGNAANNGSGSTDSLQFSAFAPAVASVGTEPSVTPASTTSQAAISYAAATGAGFGTVIFMGFYDALTTGNYLGGDYLGAFAWLPATNTSASPGVITAHAHGYSASDPVVITAKYGGVIPTFSQSNFTGVLLVVSPTTDTFTVTNAATAVNTSSTGDFSVRKIQQQSIAAGVTGLFAAGTVVFVLA